MKLFRLYDAQPWIVFSFKYHSMALIMILRDSSSLVSLFLFVNSAKNFMLRTLSNSCGTIRFKMLLTARPWGLFFSVVLSVTRPKLSAARLRITQVMMFIRLKLGVNVLRKFRIFYSLFCAKYVVFLCY